MAVTPNSGYQFFFDRAMSSFQPSIKADTNAAKAGLADQGLISSTAGQGKLADIRGKYLAAAQQSAMDSAQRQQEFGTSSAMRIFELLASQALAKKQLGIKDKNIKWPSDPTLFKDLFQQRFLPPQAASGPIGDPKEQWDRHTQNLGPTLADRNLEAQMADAAAGREIQRASLDLERRRLAMQQAAMDAEGAEMNDPWKAITSAAFSNATTDIDPQVAGLQAGALPSQLMSGFRGTYGIDVMAEAKKGNPRAVAVLKLLYPKTWQQRLSGEAISMPQPEAAPTMQQQGSPWFRLTGEGENPLSSSFRTTRPGENPYSSTVDWLSNPALATFFQRALTPNQPR